jgi:hypothetical protein
MRAVRDVVVAFNNAITTHDLDRLAALMSNDHQFIDSAGRQGRVPPGVAHVLRSVSRLPQPLRVVHSRGVDRVRGRPVVMLGGRLCGPAQWSPDVANGLITRWQVNAL